MKSIRKNTESIIIRDELVEKYLQEIAKIDSTPYSREEENRLILEAQQGNIESRNKVISKHLRFVITCVKEFQVKGIKTGDLINEGNEGLIEAVYKFDSSRNVRFISCAVWWISQKLLEYVKKNFSLIHIPFNRQAQLKKISSIKEKMELELSMELNLEDVVNLKPEENFNLDYLSCSLICSTEMQSLNTPSRDDFDPLSELLSADCVNPLDFAEREEATSRLRSALTKLNYEEKQIIKLFYGIGEGIERKESEIAEILDISSLRVRKLRLRGEEKLKKRLFSY